MKKSEIQVGGVYIAKVSGKLTSVRVDMIRQNKGYGGGRYPNKGSVHYDVTNLATGRKTTFRSAAKFRSPAVIGSLAMVGVPDPAPGCSDTGFNNRHED